MFVCLALVLLLHRNFYGPTDVDVTSNVRIYDTVITNLTNQPVQVTCDDYLTTGNAWAWHTSPIQYGLLGTTVQPVSSVILA